MMFSTRLSISLFFAAWCCGNMVSSFSPTVSVAKSVGRSTPTQRNLSQQQQSVASSSTTTRSASTTLIPLTWDEMIRQAASAMNRAANDGHSRQIVRVLLPRDATNADFGIYAEGEGTDNVNMVLCPTDESWQGGIMQLYRAAAPTTERLIRQLSTLKSTASGAAGVAPRISEDRSVDESGVDGVGLFTTSDKSIQCYVQPTQELVDDVIMDSLPSSSTMTIMLNPQWRQVDDALDTASKGEGFLSGLANMLGGKGGTLKRIKDAGFVPVYSLEGYVCRGANVRLLQVYDGTTGAFNAPWSVFCERDDGESYVAVGTSAQRPTYQDVERMLNEADIGYKYARDMGMQPKL